MTQLDNPRFTLYMDQQERFIKALKEYEPETWFPPLRGKPTSNEPGNWFTCFVPPSWGRWDGCTYGVHFEFKYAPKRDIIRLPIGVESPMKEGGRLQFKESVIRGVKRARIDRTGFTLQARDRRKLLELSPIPFDSKSWRVALGRYKALQPVVEVVSEVLREYQERGAFEVEIDFAEQW